MDDEQKYKEWAARHAAAHFSYAPTWYNPFTWRNQCRFNKAAGDIYMDLATAPDGTFDTARYKCMSRATSDTMKRGVYCIDALKACDRVSTRAPPRTAVRHVLLSDNPPEN